VLKKLEVKMKGEVYVPDSNWGEDVLMASM